MTTNTISRPVFAAELPIPISGVLDKISGALEILYGADLTITQEANHLVVWTPGRRCRCRHCVRVLDDLTGRDSTISLRAILAHEYCEKCDHRDCPASSYHGAMCKDETDHIFTDTPFTFGSLRPAQPIPETFKGQP